MYYMGQTPEEYIDQCYTTETYLKVYSHFLHPLSSKEEWPNPNTDRCKIHPPKASKMLGRPNKHARKLQPDERRPGSQNPSQRSNPDEPKRFEKASRRGAALACTTCGVTDHNSRTCALKKGNGLDIPAPNLERQKGKRRRGAAERNTQGSTSNVGEKVVNEKQKETMEPKKAVQKQKLQVRGKGKKIESNTINTHRNPTEYAVNLGSQNDNSRIECGKGKAKSVV